MQTNLDAFFFRLFTHVGVRTDVEAVDHRFGSARQHDVGFADRAGGRTDDVNLNTLHVQLLQRGLDGFRRSLHVGLDDDRNFLDFAGFDLTGQIV